MKKVVASAPGKVILIGEHAVVYGQAALALGISLKSKCIIQENNINKIQLFFENYNISLEFSDLNELIKNFPSQFNQIRYCLIKFQEIYNIKIENIKISLTSLLFPGSGLGSSASISAALIMALSEYYNIGLEKEDISSLALEMEKIVHGSPSGIDNTICTFGNLIYYKSGSFRFIEMPYELKFLVSYTNVDHDTRKAIDKIRLLKNKNPKLVDDIFNKIGQLANDAEKELTRGKEPDLVYLGKLMNRNQNLLSNLKISTKEISEINNLALKIGAYGSKLTGAGLGGCVITLGDENVLMKLSHLLEKRGYKNFITDMNHKGVFIEER